MEQQVQVGTFDKAKHAAERKAFDVAITAALKHIDKDRGKAMIQMVNLTQKVLGDTWPDRAYEALRNVFRDPDSKWMKYTNAMFDDVDPKLIKSAALNLGYEAGFRGYKRTRELSEKLNASIPWSILIDPTSACNLHCTGCWAAEYGHQMSLSYEQLDDVITQGENLGIYSWLYTGGEPTVRKNDLFKLCEKHPHSNFQCFTNGTLIDDEFCENILRVGNFFPNISLEGFEDANDGRRGQGDFQSVMAAMDRLKAHKCLFGLSICYTRANYKTVTSDEFLDMVIDKGAKYIWYFHYMPVGNDASTDLLLTPDEREYMYHRVREIRGFEGGKPIMAIDFQNDGEFVGGCVAGGREYCHINPNGDVEPCVFIHYSSANIKDKSLLECLQQPIFQKYREGQPFNENHLRPCPMLENPEKLREIVAETGAKSTDMQSPESVDSLCGKCDPYAAEWADRAAKLWKESQEEKAARAAAPLSEAGKVRVRPQANQ
jgi:MoaA/NifB/PqqE/SkfB family radical SAM enzyme